MNERLLHLWWHLIYIHIPNISINYCLKAINTRSLYKEKRANDAHNPNDVQTETEDRERERERETKTEKKKRSLNRDRHSLTEPNWFLLNQWSDSQDQFTWRNCSSKVLEKKKQKKKFFEKDGFVIDRYHSVVLPEFDWLPLSSELGDFAWACAAGGSEADWICEMIGGVDEWIEELAALPVHG